MTKIRFYDLLGVSTDAEAAALWPRSRIKSTGLSIDADPTDLVHYLQSTLEFQAVRPGADIDRVGVLAEVIVTNPPNDSPIPVVLTQIPDIEFYLQNTSQDKPARIFITHADTGTELIVEGLPVEIRLPTNVLGPLRSENEEEENPDGGPDITMTDPFEPGVYDSLQITLRDTGQSSIFVHLRVRMTEEMDFIIEPSVQISIGPCRFVGMPCKGLHDLNLVPSPKLQGNHSEGEQALEWTRHSLVDRLRLPLDATYSGMITIRTVELDNSRAPLIELVNRMNYGRSNDDLVEFVLEDISLPFFSLTHIPIPSHGQFGLRRKIKVGSDPNEAFNLGDVPVQINLGDWRLMIDQLLFRTPATLNPLDQFIFVQMGLLFGSDTDTAHAATLGITDEWTIQAGWRLPGLHIFTIADAEVKLWGTKVGWSLKRFISKSSHYKWYEQFQLLGDFGITTKGTTIETEKITFKMRSLSGKDLTIVVRNVGWDLGKFSLEPSSLPEGVQLIFADIFKLIAEEIGWVTENNGGTYFSLSGGVSFTLGNANRNLSSESSSSAINEEKSKGGGIRFRRLLFRTGGNPNTPHWLLDGISLSLDISRFNITGFGMISEFTQDNHEYREFAFGIQVEFDAIAKHFLIGMQFFHGRVNGPTDNFTYWMFGFQFSPIPIGTFELVNIRMLLAGNMTPDLPPPTGYAQNMRLFRWYKSKGDVAITMPTNRKLTGWIRKDDSFAAGLGAGLTLPVGKAIILDVFLFFSKSPEETSLMVALEVYILKSQKPVGYGAIEFDFDHDRWGFMVGVNLRMDDILGFSIPVVSRLASLTGSLYAGNKPGTFAIGQLNDQATWLTLQLSVKSFIEMGLKVAFCIQLVDMPDGPRGFGLVISSKGGANFGIGRTQIYATFGLMAGVWYNESSVRGFIIWIEAGIRIKVFGVFNFGASIRVEFDYLGPNPTYRRLGCEIRIETPWWLPDVRFRFEKIWEQPRPEELTIFSTPVTASGAISSTSKQENIGVTPIIGTEIKEREIYTINQIRSMHEPSSSTDTIDTVTPVSIDSIIALNFKPSVDNKTSIIENTPPNAGTQASTPPAKNDLKGKYEIVQIGIRRAARFGSDKGIWKDMILPEDTRLEGPADFEPGAEFTARFNPAVSFQWDRDLLRQDNLDPRRLLINASTPYTFITTNPEADESYARNDPTLPCCSDKSLTAPDWQYYKLDFKEIPYGTRSPPYKRFKLRRIYSNSTLQWTCAKPPVITVGIATPPGTTVAKVPITLRLIGGVPIGDVASISFDKPVYAIRIYCYWKPSSSSDMLVIEVYKDLHMMRRQIFPLSSGNPAVPILFTTEYGMTSVLIRIDSTSSSGSPIRSEESSETTFAIGSMPIPKFMEGVEFEKIEYLTVEDYFNNKAEYERCMAKQRRILQGAGKIAWLPNHYYEVSIITRIVLDHQRTAAQEARITQKAFFRTKGLPGLNAVKRIGEEIEPFVESRYPSPVPKTLYRSEPIALAFNEKFNILVPVDRSPSPDKPDELNQLLEWVLVVDKVGGPSGSERISQTAIDWIVANRKTVTPLMANNHNAVVINSAIVYPIVRAATSLDPFHRRYEKLVGRPSSGCNIKIPSFIHSQVLIHDPVDLGAKPDELQLWNPNATFRVKVCKKDSPFIDRSSFDEHDYTAFTNVDEGRTSSSPWTSTNNVMRVSGSFSDGVRRYAVFGNSDWNHIQIITDLDLENGRASGIAVGVAGLPDINRAIMVLIDKTSKTLKIVEKHDAVIREITSSPLPDVIGIPYTLEVTCFDDILRARIGDKVVEVPRGDIREGRLALISQDGGAFSKLIVQALDAYRFDFQSSSFVNFQEHIKSFSGSVTSIPANLLQSGSSISNTIASLLADTLLEIKSVMMPGSDPELRQRLFDRWISTVGLPLADNKLSRFEISKIVGPSEIELLLLESPEPLPFTEDVKLVVNKSLMRVDSPRDTLHKLPAELGELFAGVEFTSDRIVGQIAENKFNDILKGAKWLVRSEKTDDGLLQFHVYGISIKSVPGHEHSINLSGRKVETVITSSVKNLLDGKNPLTRGLTGMQPNQVAVINDAGNLITPDFIPITSPRAYVNVPVQVLTDGNETKALVIPIDPVTNTAVNLVSGWYRLEFDLDLIRFRAQTPDDTTNYRHNEIILTRL